MSEQSKRMLRGGARAATGLVIIGVSIAAAAVLGSGAVAIPSVERGVVAVSADTSQNATFSLICTGAFAELGADPSRPTAAIPSGASTTVVTGEPLEQGELAREQADGTAPLVVQGSANDNLAAAELQQVGGSTLQGLTASSCAEPVHEQWLVGGGTKLGQSLTLVLGNSFEVPATVQVSLFDENGQADSSRATGVLVPANSQRIVSLGGYAPDRERIAVRVESTGAAVTAALGASQTVDIRSFAVDTVTRQLAPATMLVVPGVANFSSDEHATDGAAPDADPYPVLVRVLSPEESGTATVRALKADGSSQSLGTIDFEAGIVAELSVPTWPQDAQAVTIDATVPVVAGVLGSADVPPAHDNAWFAPAPALPADTKVAVAVVLGGQLVLANTGDADASVEIEIEGVAKPKTVTVPAGAAMPVEARGQVWLTSSQPIAAGVRVVSGPNIAGYPVLAPIERRAEITVFPR